MRKIRDLLAIFLFCCVFLSLATDCCLASSMSVSPTRIEGRVSGSGGTFFITATNPGVENVEVQVKCVELVQMDNGIIGLGSELQDLPWIKIYPDRFKLGAFGQQSVSINLESVPGNVTGMYFAVVFTFSALSDGDSKVHSYGQIATQLMLSGPSAGMLNGEIQSIYVRPGLSEGEFNVNLGFKNTGSKLITASCGVSLVGSSGEVLATDTINLKHILPGAEIMCSTVLKALPEVFPKADMYDVLCEVACVDVFDPTDIKVFRDNAKICVDAGGIMIFPELRVVDVRVPVFQEGEPVRVGVLVSNNGNMPISANGIIRISNSTGEAILEEPLLSTHLLPDSSSFLEAVVEQFVAGGEYTVDVRFVYSLDKAYFEFEGDFDFSVVVDKGFESVATAALKIVPPEVELNVRAEIGRLNYVDGTVIVETVLESKGTGITYEGLIQFFGGDGSLLGFVPIQREQLKTEGIHAFTKFWHGHLPPGVYEAVLSLFVMDLDKMIKQSTSFVVLPDAKKDGWE